MKDVIVKWYKKLSFEKEYDELFYRVLEDTDVSDLTDFQSYDTKKNTPQKNLLACLYFCEALEKEYEKRGIPQRVLLDSLKDLVLWNTTYYQMYQDVGLSEFPWLNRTFLLQIFRLGRLQFCMFPSDFDIAQKQVKKGDLILEVHIPAGEPLDFDACKTSFAQVKPFFKKYFPEMNCGWGLCNSWLLDETLLPLLGEKSNVAKFQTFFKPIAKIQSDDAIKFTFLWNTTRENLKDAEPKSGFAKRLKECALTGQVFYEVLGITEF